MALSCRTAALLVLLWGPACAVDVRGIQQTDGGRGPSDAEQSDLPLDQCPRDPEKTEPGLCGCNVSEVDRDADSTPDCVDECPDDPSKTVPGDCGCGVDESDTDDDGVPDCRDCAPADEATFPGAGEICDGRDNDCDGDIDEMLECPSGCADGTREGFVDASRHPRIAGCAGGWSIPGVLSDGLPSCGRVAGDDGPNPVGMGCDVDDLCEEGWTVCASTDAVLERAPGGCGSALPEGTSEPTLFIAAVGGDPMGLEHTCEPSGTNGVFGCGNAGVDMLDDSCNPLDRALDRPCNLFSGDMVWSCEGLRYSEATQVKKSAPEHGGVLCCAP